MIGRLRRLDVTLLRDRLICELFGHADPVPLTEFNAQFSPWLRPRCSRCNARLARR